MIPRAQPEHDLDQERRHDLLDVHVAHQQVVDVTVGVACHRADNCPDTGDDQSGTDGDCCRGTEPVHRPDGHVVPPPGCGPYYLLAILAFIHLGVTHFSIWVKTGPFSSENLPRMLLATFTLGSEVIVVQVRYVRSSTAEYVRTQAANSSG